MWREPRQVHHSDIETFWNVVQEEGIKISDESNSYLLKSGILVYCTVVFFIDNKIKASNLTANIFFPRVTETLKKKSLSHVRVAQTGETLKPLVLIHTATHIDKFVWCHNMINETIEKR